MHVKRKAVWYEWVDSGGHSGWQHPDDVGNELMTCQTLGWFVKETKDSVTVALNGVFDGTSRLPFGELVTIPKCAIKRRKIVTI